ncbi:hypothetical protein [Paludisphaera mucosa]|uniref:Uncharacterized protein n=1 Tax=Paludisphaera mucosa TaxID=3030827 RepID=A0ABT6FJ15_9BACT|nr:hypothetical protein [Paludisphaera mucosa]MDG3007576.1 hypothetical protein [Paludisphaera mucosa]
MSKLEFTLLDKALIKSRGLNHVRKLGVLAAYQGGTNRVVFDNRLWEELAPAWGVTRPQYVAAVGRLQNWPTVGWLTRVENSRYDLGPAPGPGDFIKVPNLLFESGLAPWAILGVVGVLSHPAGSRGNDVFALYKVSKLKERYPTIAHSMPQERTAASGKRGGWSGQCEKAKRFADALETAGVVEIVSARRPRTAAKVKVHITEATIAALKALAPWTVAISKNESRGSDDGTVAATAPTSGRSKGRAKAATVANLGQVAEATVATLEIPPSPPVKNERPRETQVRLKDPESLKKGRERETGSRQADLFAADAANADELSARGRRGVATESVHRDDPGSSVPAYSWNFQVPPDLDPEDKVSVSMDPAVIIDNSWKPFVLSKPGILLAAEHAQASGSEFLVPAFFAGDLDPDFVYSLGRPAASLAIGRTADAAGGHGRAPRSKPQEGQEKALPGKESLKAKERAKVAAGNGASDSSGDEGYRAFVRLYNSVVHGAHVEYINLGHAPPKSHYVSPSIEPKVRKAWTMRRDHFQETMVECLEAPSRSRFLLDLSKGVPGKDGSGTVPWELNPLHLLRRWDDVLAGRYEGLFGEKVRPIAERLQDPTCQLWAECRRLGADPKTVLSKVSCGFAPYEIQFALHHVRRLKLAEKHLAA